MVGAPGFCLLYGGLASPLPFWIPDPYRGYGGSFRSPERRGGWREPMSIAMTKWAAGMTRRGVLVRLHRPAVRFQLDSI